MRRSARVLGRPRSLRPGGRTASPRWCTALFLIGIVLGLGLVLVSWKTPTRHAGSISIPAALGLADLGIVSFLMLLLLSRHGQDNEPRASPLNANTETYLGSLTADDIKLLLRLPSRIDASAPLSSGLESVLQDLTGVLGSDRGVLFLPSPQGRLERVAEASSTTASSEELLRFEETLATRACRELTGLCIPAGTHPQLVGIEATRPLSRRASWIAVPLPTSGGPGAIVLTNSGQEPSSGLLQAHVELLDLVAGSIARLSDAASRTQALTEELEALRETQRVLSEDHGRALEAARCAAANQAYAGLSSQIAAELEELSCTIDRLQEPGEGPAGDAVAALEQAVRRVANGLASPRRDAGPTPASPSLEVDSLIKAIIADRGFTLRHLGIDTRLELSAAGLRAGPQEACLRRLIEAMVQEAADRLRQGPTPRSIVVRTLRAAHRLRIVVRDDGPPLSVAELSSLLSSEAGSAGKALQMATAEALTLQGELRVATPAIGGLEQTAEVPESELVVERVCRRATEKPAGK
ncbi:MAG: GAF domain-containing protein [Planctomycetota bacterium]